MKTEIGNLWIYRWATMLNGFTTDMTAVTKPVTSPTRTAKRNRIVRARITMLDKLSFCRRIGRVGTILLNRQRQKLDCLPRAIPLPVFDGGTGARKPPGTALH